MNAASADLYQLAANLSAASGNAFPTVAATVIREAAQNIQAEAKQLAPRKTGKLANSIQVIYLNELAASIGPTVPYGVYQEFGTASRGEFGGAPYVIVPRHGRYLVFEVGGHKVFTQKVTHPGVPARPFMRPAVLHQLQQLQAALGVTGATVALTGKGQAA